MNDEPVLTFYAANQQLQIQLPTGSLPLISSSGRGPVTTYSVFTLIISSIWSSLAGTDTST